MEKVKVSKVQAAAIENWLNEYGVNHEKPKERMLKSHCGNGEWCDGAESLNDLSVEDMAKALYIGYEVEETPEDKLLEKFGKGRVEAVAAELRKDSEEKSFCMGYGAGIVDALDTLGIKIKGINEK